MLEALLEGLQIRNQLVQITFPHLQEDWHHERQNYKESHFHVHPPSCVLSILPFSKGFFTLGRLNEPNVH